MGLDNGMNKISRVAWTPVDGASAAAFRIIFGLLAFAGVARAFARGWIDDLYIQPAHHFNYLWFEWVQPLPGWGMYALFAALGVLGIFIAAGYRFRLSVILFFIGFTYIELIDKVTYLNHYYWLSLVSFLMIFMPLNGAASVDARRNPALRRDRAPAWVVWVLRGQIGVVYLFAGIAKLNPDWLLDAQPLRIWLYQHGDLPMVGALLRQAWVAYAMSWGGAFFDLTIVGWLLWGRSRLIAYLILVIFHIATWALFPQIGMFPWLMIGATLIFFSPDWPRRVMGVVSGQSSAARKSAVSDDRYIESHKAATDSWRRAAMVGLALFALAQVVIPLRHLAYPGNVRWNEEGYRFSWRVMLSEKVGSVQYRVSHSASGQAWLVAPDDYLTPLQTERMAIHPDMILQTAHFIADDFAERGYRDVEVRADAFVSMNGRANRRLVNPDVDLAVIEPSIAPKRWILPGAELRIRN